MSDYFRDELTKSRETVKNFRKEKKELTTKNQELQREISKLQRENDQFKTENENLNRDIKYLNKDIELLYNNEDLLKNRLNEEATIFDNALKEQQIKYTNIVLKIQEQNIPLNAETFKRIVVKDAFKCLGLGLDTLVQNYSMDKLFKSLSFTDLVKISNFKWDELSDDNLAKCFDKLINNFGIEFIKQNEVLNKKYIIFKISNDDLFDLFKLQFDFVPYLNVSHSNENLIYLIEDIIDVLKNYDELKESDIFSNFCNIKEHYFKKISRELISKLNLDKFKSEIPFEKFKNKANVQDKQSAKKDEGEDEDEGPPLNFLYLFVYIIELNEHKKRKEIEQREMEEKKREEERRRFELNCLIQKKAELEKSIKTYNSKKYYDSKFKNIKKNYEVVMKKLNQTPGNEIQTMISNIDNKVKHVVRYNYNYA